MPTSFVGAIQRPSLYTLSPTFQPRTYAGGGVNWVSGVRPDSVRICIFVNRCKADAFLAHNVRHVGALHSSKTLLVISLPAT